jgi:hypothetical protein
MTTLQNIIDQNLYLPFSEIASSPLSSDEELCQEIQQTLKILNYYPYEIDGQYGAVTREALREFKEEKGLTGGDILGSTTAAFLLKYAHIDNNHGILPPPFGSSVDDLACAVIKEGRKHGLTLLTQIAFIMATVQHETANTYKTVQECWWLTDEWRRQNLRYYPYYGRGYVQLTWKTNYQKYSDILGIDLVSNPDRASEPQIALFILVHGMANGIFTGRRLGQCINVNRTDFVNAAKMVGGISRTHHIANLAQQWLTRLNNLPCTEENIVEASDLEAFDENLGFSKEQYLALQRVMSS